MRKRATSHDDHKFHPCRACPDSSGCRYASRGAQTCGRFASVIGVARRSTVSSRMGIALAGRDYQGDLHEYGGA